jgi:Mg-chelatase subunit ChlD
MTRLTPSVDIASILERIGVGKDEELRRSSRRRRYLEKLSRVITPQRPSVSLDPNITTACVNQRGNEPVVTITSNEFEQDSTSLSRDVYDMTVQEALLVHEVGHILYTDSEAFQRTLSRVELGRKNAYKRIWNSLEDGAIEEQLRRKFSVTDELHVLNSNLMADKAAVDDAVEPYETPSQDLDLFKAVSLALLDLAVYDSGRLARLRDADDTGLTFATEADAELFEGLLPKTKAVVSDVLTEPDPLVRTERIYDFWVELSDALDESQERREEADSQQTQLGEAGQPANDGDSDAGDDTSADVPDSAEIASADVMLVDKPDDTTNDNIDGAIDADRLDDVDREALEESIDDSSEPETTGSDMDDESDTEALTASESQTDMDAVGDTSGSGSLTEPDEAEQRIEESRRDQLRQEGTEVDGAQELLEEVEEYMEIVTDMDEEETHVEVEMVKSKDLYESERWTSANSRSNQIAQQLRSSLREERRSRLVKNQRQGRFDRSRMINAARGSPRVFEREREGNDKDYDCLIVLDRSGSMRGSTIRLAEDAVTSFALALEDVSVGVSVVGMRSNTAGVENAFGRSVEDDRGSLLSERCGGGTPLTETLALARRRLEGRGDSSNPFILVVTDGRPNHPQNFREELSRVNFPVLGIYVNTDRDDSSLYHRQVNVSDESEIDESMLRLAREVMM